MKEWDEWDEVDLGGYGEDEGKEDWRGLVYWREWEITWKHLGK